MDANMKKYEDNKLIKMLRKLKGIISKSQGVLDIDISDYKNIDSRIKEAFKTYLNLLESECKQIGLDEKYFFDGILYDLDNEAFKIYVASSNENTLNFSRFFRDNPYAKFYYTLSNGEIYINENLIMKDGKIDQDEALPIIAHAFEHYLYNRFKDKEEKIEEYKWLEEGINEIASKRILNDDMYDYNNYVTYIKSAFRYRMLSGKSFDEFKIYAEHKLGRTSYLRNILTRDFCKNVEAVLLAKREDVKTFSDKEFAQRLEDIYLKYILDINRTKIKNIAKYSFEDEYKRYFTLTKNLNVNNKNVHEKILQRILDDTSTYCRKNTENEVEAIKMFLKLINEDIIYKSEFQDIDRKLRIIIQILTMKSKYGDNVERDFENAINKFKNVITYQNSASLEIEPLSGRFQIKILKEKDDDISFLFRIDKGDILYNEEHFLATNNNKFSIATFLYDGTIKKESIGEENKIKKINMQNEVDVREFERQIRLNIIEYKTLKAQLIEKAKEAEKEFNEYFKRYISKYIMQNEYKMDIVEKVLDKTKYEVKKDEQVNNVILKYFSKTSEEDFLSDEENNVKNLVGTFIKSDRVYRES